VLHSRYNSKINSGENFIADLQRNHLHNPSNSVSFIYLDNLPSSSNFYKRYFFITLNVLFSLEAIVKVATAHRKNGFDVFLIHNLFPNFGLFFFIYLKLLRVPYVLVLHNFRYRCISGAHELSGKPCFKCSNTKIGLDGFFNKCFKRSFWASFFMILFRILTRVYIKNAGTIICLSNYAKTELKSTPGFFRNVNVKVVPNFYPSLAGKRFGGYDFKTVFFAGRLESSKGIEKLLECWVRSELPLNGWKLILCGTGELASMVEAKANKTSSIEYLGLISHDEVMERLKKTSFSVVPSVGTENCPTTIIESFSQSVPVIGPNAGSINEMITSKSGIKFDKDLNNLDHVFNQILKMTSADYLRFEAYETWLANYSPHTVIPQLFDVIHDSMGDTFNNHKNKN
jgi:glycosyltransferase involved in cell wall biosynthesis